MGDFGVDCGVGTGQKPARASHSSVELFYYSIACRVPGLLIGKARTFTPSRLLGLGKSLAGLSS